jgi:SNF2 family DNA or RNA helicase
MVRQLIVNVEYKSLSRSPKINALLQAITELGPNVKCVVMSQWCYVLDVIHAEFDDLGYTHCRIDGNQSVEQRLISMERFNSIGLHVTDSPQFVLCTTQASARYINLHCASVMFMMDSIWDAAAEDTVSFACCVSCIACAM